MCKVRVLVVGLGEVGRPLYDIAVDSGCCEVYGYDIDASKTVNRLEEIVSPIDYLHIAIPYSNRFVEVVKSYIDMFSPRIVFIHSTVAPGTSRKIYNLAKKPVAYTPVRGKHPNLKKHLLFWPKWVAALPHECVDEAASHLEDLGLKVRRYDGPPESLELAKLWETVYRAIMIASWQELHRIARQYNADLLAIADFVGEVHQVLHDRPVYYPAYIGGHCLIPNTRILFEVTGSPLFKFVLESNEKRAKELEDESVKREVEELKKKVFEEYINKSYYMDP